jgi:hypothetical protein
MSQGEEGRSADLGGSDDVYPVKFSSHVARADWVLAVLDRVQADHVALVVVVFPVAGQDEVTRR